MTANRLLSPNRNRNEAGVAIVIVLAFVVLLTGVVIAFFSRAVMQRQVSSASFSRNSVEHLAQAATNIIVGDLKEEIRMGSSVQSFAPAAQTVASNPPGYSGAYPTPTPGPLRSAKVYQPSLPLDVLPKRIGNPGNPNPNFIRRSLNNDVSSIVETTDRSATVSSRASGSSSSSTSANGRFISARRWNAHGLNPVASGATFADLTPTSFNAPDWVIVTKTGPRAFPAWSTTLTNKSGDDYAIGRYAYVIYDEGGLLDTNFAGYPSGTTGGTASDLLTQYGRKTGLSYANLQEIPGLEMNGASVADNLVAWRNHATSLGNTDPAAFDEYLFQNSNGFLQLPTKIHQNRTDQTFASRQAFLKFWRDHGYPAASLQYFGTFSRGLHQPSYQPNTAEPGHNGTINPSFLAIRKGSNPAVPLVSHRFPLNRLAWLTSVGPSDAAEGVSPNGSTVQAALVAQGFSEAFLNEGMSSAIQSKFGLAWDATERRWTYFANAIADLASVAAEVPAREPNFFELLKAATKAGSLGKSAIGTGYQAGIDNNIDNNIAQLVANIIDQYDSDSFPTRIDFNNRPFYGVENLPYIYRLRTRVVPVVPATPAPAANPQPPDLQTPANQLTSNGEAVVLLQPEVWNPHHALAVDPTVGPLGFQFVATSAQPFAVGSSPNISNYFQITALATAAAGGPFSGGQLVSSQGTSAQPSYPAITGDTVQLYQNASQYPVSSSGVTDLYSFLRFSVALPANVVTEFSQPRALQSPDPAISLTMDGEAFTAAPPLRIGILPSGTAGNRFITDSVASGQHVGIYLGSIPLRWIAQDSGTHQDYILTAETVTLFPGGGSTDLTVKLMYLYDNGRYYPYDEKVIPADALFAADIQTIDVTNPANVLNNIETWGTVSDPRTPRFGIFAGRRAAGSYAPATGFTDRPDGGEGQVLTGLIGVPAETGWSNIANFAPGYLQQNVFSSNPYFADDDGVVRRGIGGMNDGVVGLPMATANAQSRPVILNRPFRSVGELGYVFSGIPWRNIDFSHPESGFAALLDTFCIQEVDEEVETVPGMVAGKVNLNTRQERVLAAVLRGSLTDEIFNNRSPGEVGVETELTSSIAELIAARIVSRTTGTAFTSGQGPFRSIADVVGRLGPVTTPATPLDGSSQYYGLGSDLNGTVYSGSAPAPEAVPRHIPRLKEAAIRALSSVGETRVWNLMIDVVAQTGRYPVNATSLDAFAVEAERRYWVHVAIDRYTGEVIDQQIEIVKE